TASFQVVPDGIHSVTYTATDVACLTSAPKTDTIKIDTAPPTSTHALSPASPNGNASWYVTGVHVPLSAPDALSGGSEARSSINGGASTFVVGTGATIALPDDGSYAIQYFATDNAGNVEAVQTLVVKVD